MAIRNFLTFRPVREWGDGVNNLDIAKHIYAEQPEFVTDKYPALTIGFRILRTFGNSIQGALDITSSGTQLAPDR